MATIVAREGRTRRRPHRTISASGTAPRDHPNGRTTCRPTTGSAGSTPTQHHSVVGDTSWAARDTSCVRRAHHRGPICRWLASGCEQSEGRGTRATGSGEDSHGQARAVVDCVGAWRRLRGRGGLASGGAVSVAVGPVLADRRWDRAGGGGRHQDVRTCQHATRCGVRGARSPCLRAGPGQRFGSRWRR